MPFRFTWRAAVAAFSISLLIATAAQAAVVLSGTRVIYGAQAREVTLRLTNEGQGPVLVQSWIDGGDLRALPDQVEVPFILTPPLFRLDPQKGQTLRIIYTQDPLPQDRESLFWLNAMEVPPRPSTTNSLNTMQLALRTRIKLFFRPAGLVGKANEAAEQVLWRFVKRPNGGYALLVDNPTPYHVTFTKISLTAGGRNFTLDAGGMVAPLATAQFDVGHVAAVEGETPSAVHYSFVNDYGATVEGEFHAGSR